jgi:hypothetical protein
MTTEPLGSVSVADSRAKPNHTVHWPSGRSALRKLIELATSVAIAILGVYWILD